MGLQTCATVASVCPTFRRTVKCELIRTTLPYASR